ncbi:MAG TPA: tetratricopeptide repeat protein, partial [Kofleriaceae bacterium]|nr:tetratricopeptide repeat protein [Kofleriaceae bacterium]
MVSRCSVVAVLPLIAVLVGDARAGAFTHEASVKPEVRLSERAKPPPRHDAPPAPPSADTLLAVEVELADVHLEQADLLRDLIKRTPDENAEEKADYSLRLGEIHGKTQRLHRLKGAEDAIALGKETDPKRRAALAASAASHKSAETAAVVAAIDTYKTLIENPRLASYPHLDTAVFYLAYTLRHAQRPKEARAAYDKLLKDYPRSRFVADAYLALADYAYDVGQLDEAASRYQKVLKFPAAPRVRYARYKLGWVELNQRKYQDALEKFFQVAQETAQAADQQVLHRAATHDFVRAYAEIGRADRALPAFQRLDGKDPYGMLAALGDLYLDQGKYDRAIFVYRELISEQPRSANVCAWQHAVARATLVAGTAGDKVHEIEQLVRLYTALRDHKALPAGEAAECREAAADMSGQLARAYHQEAVKTQNPEYFGYADRLYRAYLGAFRDAADFADTQYFHAELAWGAAEREHAPELARQKWQDAANAFTLAIDTGKLGAQRVQVSADAAMQAWMKALAVDPHAHPEPPRDEARDGAPPVPRPLPEPQQKLLAAYDVYLTHIADGADDERIAVTFLKADLLRRFDHLAEVIPLFEGIVAHHPDHETAEYAAQLVLDSYNRLSRYPEMLGFAGGLSQAFLAAHPRVGGVVAELGHQALRKEAERLEAKGHATGDLGAYIACGERYLEIYNLSVDAP